jgi:hypothetical protein
LDRLYTAFVSSTYLDLREERQRLVRVLLEHRCVPFGMEFFPSTGRTQWPIIQESMAAADFCIFVVGGRYGTTSDIDGISWTHREFREAIAAGKPIVGILHAAPADLPEDKRDHDDQALARLAAFRKEVEHHTVCRYYIDLADLMTAVTASLAVLRDEGRIQGWVPAGRNPVVLQESDFDRVYELVSSSWRFSSSSLDRNTWDGDYRGHRIVVGQDPDGLPSMSIDFTRDSDRELPFDVRRQPRLSLTSIDRSVGTAVLGDVRKSSGGTFVQDLVLRPPLGSGERLSYTFRGHFPSYKYGRRDDLLSATKDSRHGPRTFDWASRNVVYPTRHLELSVFLPLSLEASPRGPLIGRTALNVDRELTSRLINDGSYSSSVVVVDGVEGHLMRLEIDDPRLRRYYRLAWELP